MRLVRLGNILALSTSDQVFLFSRGGGRQKKVMRAFWLLLTSPKKGTPG